MFNVTDWLISRDGIVACVAFAFVMLFVGALFAREFRKLSRRGVIVFVIGAGIATGVAQKRMSPAGDSRGFSPIVSQMSCGLDMTEGDTPPSYTNPVRFTSFLYNATTLTATVTWDWGWAPDAFYHYLDFYGTYALPTNGWVDAGRRRIDNWGSATNLSVVLEWPTVFSNAVVSGTFPTNASLESGFISVFPELDTDGDGLYDGEEMRIYGTRWDLRDSDGDGLEDPDELFDVGSDPMNPDSDGDGMPDGWEWYGYLDPNDPSDILGDYDRDGLSNYEESVFGTRPDHADTDGDLLSDYDEVHVYWTNPVVLDTDCDGMDDRAEILNGFDPCFAGEYHGPERPDGYNPDAYFNVGVTADEPMTWVTFEGDGVSYLADPSFYIRSNETVDVTLLLGKTYHVFATNSAALFLTGLSGASVVTNAPGDFTIVRPVTISLVPEYTLLSLGAGSSGSDGSFRLSVYPDVGGVFEWTNSCCAITSLGNRFWFACGGQCTCSGCRAYGRYVYEGYGLPCVGGFCACSDYDDDEDHYPTEPDDGPYAAGISVSFSESVVIFEDAYDNNPTSSVPLRSSLTTLSCLVHGGETGGLVEFEMVNASKINPTENDLPDQIFVPPLQKLEFEVEYEGSLPSGSENDITVVGTFTPSDGGPELSDFDSMTSVRLELEVVVAAPTNNYSRRHWFGVFETVNVKVLPSTVNYDCTLDGDDMYVFSDGGRIWCPWTNGAYHVNIDIGDVGFSSMIKVFEPTVCGYRPRWNGSAGTVGVAGMVIMDVDLYVKPFDVSFFGLWLEEIPDESQSGLHFGYYDDRVKGGNWSHTASDGAGKWHCVRSSGYLASDSAGRNLPYAPPYITGWKEWEIPVGYSENTNELRRTISPDPTSQRYEIDDRGKVTIIKWGHRISRDLDNEVKLDGVVVD